jgi:hypothetical protein
MSAALRKSGAPRDLRELQYRDAHRALSEHGHIPGVNLDPGSLLLAIYLLANGPGYIIRRATIARDLGVSERIASMRLARLRNATIAGVPLLRSRIAVPLHGRMPWWRPSDEGRAEANRYAYEVAAAEILSAIAADRARQKAERAAERETKRARRTAWLAEHGLRLVNRSCTSGQDLARTLDPDLGSSPASPPTPAPEDCSASRETASPSATSAASETPSSFDAGSHAADDEQHPGSAVKGEENEPCPRAGPRRRPELALVEPEVDKLAQAWDALGLVNGDGTPSRVRPAPERRCLRRRLCEGYSAEDLLDAIAAVRESPEDYCQWVREGRARAPFAVVFDVNGLDRFVHAGRKLQWSGR